jgi:N-methylhydantoinase A
MWRVGIDVGGTFTDLFAWNEGDGRQVSSKVLTTRPDRSQGVLNALEAAGIGCGEISFLMHGTTTATNALLERNYPDPAMVTTEGFRDTIEIGRQHREFLYDPYQVKPRPIIKRRYRYSINERMNVAGETVRELNEAAAREIARKIKAHGIKSVAVAFINSYKNGAHECLMRDIIQQEAPETYVVLSHETRPVFREHGRFTTTAIRAAMIPVMEDYFERLENALKARGFKGALLILKSSGGITGVDYARQHPEELIESGPAGGVAYAGYLSKLLGQFPNIIHTDVGGTSFDVSIVENGKGLITRDHEIEWEIPCIVPMLDIHSVGAGGGSIGWMDEGGSLRAGPRSAGSSPGPVCYGLGGTEPAITDANLLLGRIEPTLGGKMQLDKAGAEAAMERLAAQIGLSPIETADGLIRIACENMAQAVKKVLVSRGRDPRDFILASFGGAGAMHACFVAESMNIPKVIMPIHAGVASAFGATAMDLRQDLEAFYFSPVVEADLATVNRLFESLEKRAVELLLADGIPRERIELSRSAQMRYVGQTYEVDTPLPSKVLEQADIPAIIETFHQYHEREYGVSSNDFAPALVALGVTAIGKMATPPPMPAGASGGDPVKGQRQIYFNGAWHPSTVYDGHALKTDASVAGPCIVEYEHACAVLPPNAVATVDTYGNLIIDISRNLKTGD